MPWRRGLTHRRSLGVGLALAAIVLAVGAAHGGTLNASWTAPTTNVDGSALTDLAAYRVYYATSSTPCPGSFFVEMASPTSSPPPSETVTLALTGLAAGSLYYVSVTAVDDNGNESACLTSPPSAVVRFDIGVTPTGTTNFGTAIPGSFVDQTFTVQDTAGGTVSGTAWASAPFSVVSGSPFSLVGAGATQAVVVRFIPTLSVTASANVSFTANGDTISRLVSGTGTLDATSPSVLVTSPTSNATYSTSSSVLTLAGTASDNLGVTQVTWTNARGGGGTATGTTSWTADGIVLQAGANVLTVTARDAAGNIGTATVTVTFSDSTPPTVALTAPTAGATVTGTVTITATATDNIGVAGVQFTLDGIKLGTEVTAPPYTVSWNTTTATSGTHTLTAVARDGAGNITTSPAVSVAVVPPANVYRTGAPITVDGDLSDWSGATAIQFSGRSNSATAYLQWDDTNLYVAFKVTDPQLNATRTARDAGGIYLDDSVEALSTLTVTAPEIAVLPAVSLAIAVRVYVPSGTAVVVQTSV